MGRKHINSGVNKIKIKTSTRGRGNKDNDIDIDSGVENIPTRGLRK